MDLQLPKLIAHRGASADAPENVLAAIHLAHEMGAQWVEFDVRLTRDDHVILLHDDDVDRTTSGVGLAIDLTLNEITELDAGGWFSHEFKNVKIPTFKEVIHLSADLGLGMNVEVKPSRRPEKLAELILALLAEHWPADAKPILISSFSYEVLEIIRSMNSEVALALLADHYTEEGLQFLQEIEGCSYNLNSQYLNAEVVNKVKSHGYNLVTFTVNETSFAKQLLAMGVDSIISNHANLL